MGFGQGLWSILVAADRIPTKTAHGLRYVNFSIPGLCQERSTRKRHATDVYRTKNDNRARKDPSNISHSRTFLAGFDLESVLPFLGVKSGKSALDIEPGTLLISSRKELDQIRRWTKMGNGRRPDKFCQLWDIFVGQVNSAT